MSTFEAPAVPDPSALRDLDPGVAYAFLAVVLVALLLFYFGPAMRDRLTRKTQPPPAPSPPLPVSAPAAVDRVVIVTDELIEFMKAELEYLRRQNADKDREITRLRDLDWRRGPS